MRVSQQMLFTNYISNMNKSLSELMELNIQAQTQKKVNKPSDDPSGMANILDHRDAINALEQYEENISTAKGWLAQSDGTIQQVSVLLTRAKELAQQAATGTLTDDNREQIGYELRNIMSQLVGLSNTEFSGKSIYAGHKTDQPAFKEILWMTTNDENLVDTGSATGSSFSIEGDSRTTVLVQFYDTTGATPTGGSIALSNPNCAVRYSVDGGDSWETDGAITVAGSNVRLDLPSSGTAVVFDNVNTAVKVTPENDPGESQGTWLWLRPSAQYMGDDEESIAVQKFGANLSTINATVGGGTLNRNLLVRIDNSTAVGLDQQIEYSYSEDGGMTWVSGNTTPADGTASNAVISIPPAVLTLTSNGGNTLQPGNQFLLTPRTASINLGITSTETVRINDVGMDIFGGIFQDPDLVLSAGGDNLDLASSNASVVFSEAGNPNATIVLTSNSGGSKNLFETIGNLVAFLETNNQTGVQQALANLKEVHAHVMNSAGSVGGRENRVETAEAIIDSVKINEIEQLSQVEDVDITELMTQLTQQQIVYESVLRSASMIMQMNLMKYI